MTKYPGIVIYLSVPGLVVAGALAGVAIASLYELGKATQRRADARKIVR
jgi:hypothetical protein